MKFQISHNKSIYNLLAKNIVHQITKRYSSSFYRALKLVDYRQRQDIYSIYAYVRLIDEIVDTFRPKSAKQELDIIFQQTKLVIQEGFSSNIVVYQFGKVIKKYNIPFKYIDAFYDSMLSDITKNRYNIMEYKKYIYGSAEVVGLMCLYVFFNGDIKLVERFSKSAQALGSAFQKVNFLRDLATDKTELGRFYFPNIDFEKLDMLKKNKIVADIKKDFKIAQSDIKKLPKSCRYGVGLAYEYYLKLLDKVDKSTCEQLVQTRISINRLVKLQLYCSARLRKFLNW